MSERSNSGCVDVLFGIVLVVVIILGAAKIVSEIQDLQRRMGQVESKIKQ